MADYTKNISNTVNVFGLNPSTKWGEAVLPYTMTWGTSKWGEGTSPQVFQFTKVYNNDQASTFDYAYSGSQKVLDIGSAPAAFELSDESLVDGIWEIVFVSDTTNLSERDDATWTVGTVTDATFVCGSTHGATWSEA